VERGLGGACVSSTYANRTSGGSLGERGKKIHGKRGNTGERIQSKMGTGIPGENGKK